MENEYKPILVLYINEADNETRYEIIQGIEGKFGFKVLIFTVEDNFRAEIISVDKATVVEDIQKYIDQKLETVK